MYYASDPQLPAKMFINSTDTVQTTDYIHIFSYTFTLWVHHGRYYKE